METFYKISYIIDLIATITFALWPTFYQGNGRITIVLLIIFNIPTIMNLVNIMKSERTEILKIFPDPKNNSLSRDEFIKRTGLDITIIKKYIGFKNEYFRKDYAKLLKKIDDNYKLL